MSLSNIAVPYYYGIFRDAVIRGEIPVCLNISMQMQRIDSLIANPNYFYDSDAVNGFISYCENELTLTDGRPLKLLPSFKLWAEDFFGWYEFVERSVWVPSEDGKGNNGYFETKLIKKRLRNKQFLILGRGGAKTMYSSCIHDFFLNIDTSTTTQWVVAPTMRQSEETLQPIKTSITRAPGPLKQFLTYGSLQNTTGSKKDRCHLASTKKGIENFFTGSIIEIRPLSIDKLQGGRCKIATFDEWLSGEIRQDPITALEQSASKIDDYAIICTSSEGTIRNGIGDTIKMELMSILKGEYINDHVSIWYYRLDDISEINDPRLWVKAQPNIGYTVTYETYQLEVEKAEKNPASRNEILAKRFGIPCEGFTYFFTYEETLPHRYSNFNGMPCALGADLSQGDDFCAFTFLFPLQNGRFGIKARSYISELTMMRLPAAMREKYEDFLKEGSLVVMPGNILDNELIYDDLEAFIDAHGYDVCSFGYDPYNAKEFIERWSRENSAFGVEKVIQGMKTETVPLGELKNLAEQRMLLFDESIMRFCMGNSIVIEDNNGNRKLYKKRREAKIDNVSALMDAFVSYKANRDAFA